MRYPGRVIKSGETDGIILEALSSALAKKGYAVDEALVSFDSRLISTIKLFQAQNVDVEGRPLRADGQVGPLIWGALFGVPEPKRLVGGLASAAMAVAAGQIGVMEKPAGSNAGPEVNVYLKSVGLGPGYYWCMAFVHWCFEEAAKAGGEDNPFPRTAGCIDAWNKVKAISPKFVVTRAQAIANPTLVKPGQVFILDFGRGAGHTGFVTSATSGALRTIEGNTNVIGSGNGLGVFELNRRTIMDRNLRGFINLS